MYFTLADLITDIAQNAYESGAGLLKLDVEEDSSSLCFSVQDNGKGMNNEELRRAIDPFFSDGMKHPQRKVGLGIPFFIQTAEQSGGGWDIRSSTGEGTSASAWFDTGNVDTPPLGDLPETFRTMLMLEVPEVIIRRSKLLDGKEGLDYQLCKTELSEVLGDLMETGSQVLLDQYLRSLENE